MAASILSSLWRVRLFSGYRLPVVAHCGLRTRPPFSPEFGDEDELESEENEEQEMMRTLKRSKEAIRLKRIKREMEPTGAPERRLNWNAMEQIRYLKQEFPEEWTLQRLATGFNVSTDVIRRVLKSKFVPSETRKTKQDAAASRNLGQFFSRTSHDQNKLLPLSKDPEPQLLAHANSGRHLPVSYSPPLLPSPKSSDISQIAVRTKDTHIANSLVPESIPQKVQGVPPPPAVPSASPKGQEEAEPSVPVEEDWQTLDEGWDGEVLSDQELDELANSGLENKMVVVQKGSEFFDSDGKLIYRI